MGVNEQVDDEEDASLYCHGNHVPPCHLQAEWVGVLVNVELTVGIGHELVVAELYQTISQAEWREYEKHS